MQKEKLLQSRFATSSSEQRNKSQNALMLEAGANQPAREAAATVDSVTGEERPGSLKKQRLKLCPEERRLRSLSPRRAFVTVFVGSLGLSMSFYCRLAKWSQYGCDTSPKYSRI